MPLKPFSEHDAKGNGILQGLDKFDGDVYIDHMSITDEDDSIVVLLTDRRILNLHQRKFWHSWEVRWSCLYEDVVGFPLLTENGLVIKEQSSKDHSTSLPSLPTHDIVSSNRVELETLKTKIDSNIRHFR